MKESFDNLACSNSIANSKSIEQHEHLDSHTKDPTGISNDTVSQLTKIARKHFGFSVPNSEEEVYFSRLFWKLKRNSRLLLICLALDPQPLSFSNLELQTWCWNFTFDLADGLDELESKGLILEKTPGWVIRDNKFHQFISTQFLAKISQEIISKKPDWLYLFPLVYAEDKEHTKEDKKTKILNPILEFLIKKLEKERLIKTLNLLVDSYRYPSHQEGFGVANIINLLALVNNYALEDLDLSRMCIWGVDFRNIKLKNVNFDGSDLSGSLFLQHRLGKVLSLDISPDGKYLATGDAEGWIRVYEVETGYELYSNCKDNSCTSIWVVKFDPTGRIIASAGDNCQITLWEFENSDLQLTIGTNNEHTDSIRTLTFADQNILISGSGDHNILCWNITSQRDFLEEQTSDIPEPATPEQFHLSHANSVRSLAISKNRDLLVSGSSDGNLALWKKNERNNTVTWEMVKVHEKNYGKVRGVVFHPSHNSRYIAVYDEVIEIYQDSKLVKKIPHNDGKNQHNCLKTWIVSVAINSTGEWLAIGDENGCIKIVDLNLILNDKAYDLEESLKYKHVYKAHDKCIRSLKFFDEYRLVSAGEDCSVKTWQIRTIGSGIEIQNFKIIKGYSNWIWSLIYSKDGNYLFSSHGDCKIRVWKNNEFDSPFRVIEGHLDIVRTMSITSDGKFLVTGSCDCLVRLWNIEEIRERNSNLKSIDLKGHQSWIRCVRAHPTKPNIIASCGDDTTIKIWNIENPEHPQTLGEENYQICQKEKDSDDRHTDPVRTICFDENGEYLASGGGDKKIIVWKQENSEDDIPKYKLFDCKVYKDKAGKTDSADWVYSLTFSEGNLIAVSGGDGLTVFKLGDDGIEDRSSNSYLHSKLSSECKILKQHSQTGKIGSGGTNDYIEIFINGHSEYRSKEIHYGTIRAMDFHPDGKILVTGGKDGNLYVWNVEKIDKTDNSFSLERRKRLVEFPYVNISLNLVSGISLEEKERILELISYKKRDLKVSDKNFSISQQSQHPA